MYIRTYKLWAGKRSAKATSRMVSIRRVRLTMKVVVALPLLASVTLIL
jgi:hypothetical protein